MSEDYLIIAPSDYTFDTFRGRVPSNFCIADLACEEGFGIDNGEWHVRISKWDPIEDCCCELEEWFNPDQLSQIATIPSPKFFAISGLDRVRIHKAIAIIANDPKVLIENDTVDAIIIPGDEFVRNLANE